MRGIIRWLVDHSTTVYIAALCTFLFGVLAWVTLPRESSPDITIPVVIVTTPYQGVSPSDVENLVSTPIENELASLRGIKKLTSTSAEGVSIVVTEFEPESNIEDALQRVRDRVSRARPKLPEDVDESSVREISFSDIPVVLINIAGPVDEEQLKVLAEDLQEELTRIEGVLDVKLSGGKEREVQVQVFPERLAHYGLSLRDVAGAIGDENVNIPGGNVDLDKGNVLLRVPGEFSDPREIEGVAIKRVGDMPVFVRDVARVVDGYAERATYARMAGEPSVTLAVTKRAGANILEVASRAKELAAVHSESWPEGVYFRALGDQSARIQQSVDDLQNNIITALILVVGVIVFFMGWRPSLFVAVSIPLSMFGAMLVLQALGFTLNMVVLFSLILALGMLVDNAIVVVENVYRHAEMGKPRREAAIDGTSEVAIAVAASTATTVAAFFPLVFWGGIMGEFMGFLPKTVIIVLVMSLLVAVGVLPSIMRNFMPELEARLDVDEAEDPKLRDAQLGTLMSLYRTVLQASIRWRYLSVGLGVASLIGTFIIYVPLNHGTEFFPESSPERAIVGVRMPEGTDVETTDAVVRELEGMLAREPNVDTWTAQSGVSAGGDALSGTSTRPNEARITVDFLPDRNTVKPGQRVRVEDTFVTVDRLRAQAQQIPGARVTVEPEAMGPPVGDPIKVEISGEDYDEVGIVAQRVRRMLEQVPGTTDLRDDYVFGRPELRLRIDRGAAKRVGVSTAAVGDAVRTAIAGSVATQLRDGEDEIDVVVELAPEYREDIQQVLSLRLPGREDTSPNTFPVPLSTVASYELVGGSGSIQHVDQDLVVTITGDILDGYNENEVRAAVAAAMEGYELPDGMGWAMTGANQEQEEAMFFLLRAFAIAVCLILLVLVTQFDSLAMPFIILATVILSLIGVLWGLLITGTPFGVIMTGIGVISLAGVVVNNAIVLLDYVQQLLARGLSVADALVEAGLTRFRPVMLTAITTALGLIPMAAGVAIDFIQMKLIIGSSSAQWWGPMAVAVIFGLSFATVLTLVMVPTLYSIYDDIRNLPGRIRSMLRRPTAAEATAASALLLLVPVPSEALTLDEAVKAAERDNLELQLARERVFEQSTVVGQVWASLSPRASLDAAYVINNQEIVADFGDFDAIFDQFGPLLPTTFEPPSSEPVIVQRKAFWQGNFNASWRLFNGQAAPAMAGAYKLRDAARADMRRIEQQIRAGTTAAYYGLLTAQQRVAVAEQGLALAEAQKTLAERQVEAGLADRRATVQARLAVSQAERDLDVAREGLVSAEQGFRLSTGLEPEALEVPEPVAVPDDVESALVDARVHRPDLEANKLRTEAASFERTSRYMDFLPVVDSNFTYSYTENTGFNDRNWTWRLVFQATWTLWDGGFSTVERQAAASRVRQAQLQEALSEQQAERDVRVAFEAYRRASTAYASVENELALARENLELAERTYAAGSSTWLELEQAKLQLQSTELVALQERMNRDLAAVDLLVATGRL